MVFKYHTALIQRIIDETNKAVAGLIILSLLFIWVYKEYILFEYMCLWGILQSIFIIFRYLNSKKLQNAINNEDIKQVNLYKKEFYVLVIYSAVVWNFGVILGSIFAPSPYEFVGLIVIVGTITAGTLSLLPIFYIYITYFFMLLIPQIFIMLKFNTNVHHAIIFLLFIYVPLIFFLSKSIYKNYINSIKNNYRLHKSVEKLRELSTKDFLTNIYNRRFFVEFANNSIKVAKRENKPLSFLMFDIDDFKKVNDIYGHQCGDIVLVNISKIIKNELRESDVFARIGGEEFGILLINTSSKGTILIAEKIRKSIENHLFQCKDIKFNITISLGIAIYNEKIETFDEIYTIADRNLYKAKRNGKNQINHSW